MISTALLVTILMLAVLAVGFMPIVAFVLSESRTSRGADLGVAARVQRASRRAGSHNRRRPDLADRVADVPAYVASNGVIVTPTLIPMRRIMTTRATAHPHAEYWAYGTASFYE